MKKKLDRTAVGSEALKSACHRDSRTHLQDKKFNTEGSEKHTSWQHCGLTCTKQAEQTGLLAKSKASEVKQSIKYASIFLMVEGSSVTCKSCKMGTRCSEVAGRNSVSVVCTMRRKVKPEPMKGRCRGFEWLHTGLAIIIRKTFSKC